MKELLQRKPRPSEGQTQPDLRRLRKDGIDLQRDKTQAMINAGLSAYAFSVPLYVDVAFLHGFEPSVAKVLPVLPAVTYFYKWHREYRARKEWEKQDTLSSIYGYESSHMVYKGKEPLQIGDQTLHKGDNFMHVQLPGLRPIKRSEGGGNIESIRQLLYDVSLKNVRENISDRDYKVVVIEMPGDQSQKVPRILADAQTVTNEQLVTNKAVRLESQESKLMVLTRQEFEEILVVCNR